MNHGIEIFFPLFLNRKAERSDTGNYPQGACQLDGRGHFEGFVAVGGGGSDNRTRVVDGNGAPQSELVLREAEQVSDEREDHEGDGIQQEDNTERYGYLLLRCIDCGSHGGYRAATAYRRAGGYQMGGFARHFEPSAHEVAEYEDGRNRGDGEAQPFAAHLQGALHVHSEAKPLRPMP